jgi:hypothetical protein
VILGDFKDWRIQSPYGFALVFGLNTTLAKCFDFRVCQNILADIWQTWGDF